MILSGELVNGKCLQCTVNLFYYFLHCSQDFSVFYIIYPMISHFTVNIPGLTGAVCKDIFFVLV